MMETIMQVSRIVRLNLANNELNVQHRSNLGQHYYLSVLLFVEGRSQLVEVIGSDWQQYRQNGSKGS